MIDLADMRSCCEDAKSWQAYLICVAWRALPERICGIPLAAAALEVGGRGGRAADLAIAGAMERIFPLIFE